ncbi:ABC transporter permease [Bacillota bacterium LX-D]|nr:ABC transporter permease [Bacillota bacterium LX-D]
MLVIAKNTFQEIIHKKVFLLVLFLTIAFLGLYGTALYFAYKNPGSEDMLYRSLILSQLLSAGLYFASFINAFLVVVASAGAISAEIENGTLYAIIPKPIKRSSIVIGKFLGLGIMLIVYAALFFASIILLTQILSHWSFTFLTTEGIIKGLLLFCLEPLILLGLGIWGTTFLPTINNGILIVMLYGLGMIGGIIEQIGALVKNTTMEQLGIASSLIMPTDAIYRKMTGDLFNTGLITFQGAGPFGAVNQPSNWMVVYALLYFMIFLIWGVHKFKQRDI